MAFPKKKAADTTMGGVAIDQNNIAMLATKALADTRAQHVMLAFTIVFTSPVLMHRWSQKAINQMLAKMTGASIVRPPKDLTEEYEASWYRNQDGNLAIPSRLLKACIVEGAIATGGTVTKAQLKRELRVRGFTCPITIPKGLKVEMDTQIASNNGTPDVRARALIPEGAFFEAVLDFPPTLTPDKVMAATTSAGACIGLCDWRPDRGGEHGTFEVRDPRGDSKTIERVLKACSVPEQRYEIPPELLRSFRAMSQEQLDNAGDTAGKVAAVVDHVNGQGDDGTNGAPARKGSKQSEKRA